jgi:hypothetical protein
MTAVIEDGAIGPTGRISTLAQVRGAVARMRQAGPPLAAVWLGLGGAYGATTVIASQLGVDTEAGYATWGYLAYASVSAVIGAIGGAMALRLLVGHAGWRSLDAGVLAYALITAAQSMVFVLIMSGLTYLSGSDEEAMPFEDAMAGLMLLLGFFVAAYVYLKVMLWPAGQLLGRFGIGPWRSWRLMRRVKRGYILGLVLFGIPLAVVSVLAARWSGPDSSLFVAATVVTEFAMAAYLIAGQGMVAVIYERRVEGPSNVADVFD